MASGSDMRDDIREFLSTRRARLAPEQAGLPAYGSHRRVPGLRREEVAMLAGVSIDYYIRLERGNVGGVSPEVVESLARALHLDDVERAHLVDLVRLANASPSARDHTPPEQARRGVRQILDSMSGAAAFVRNTRLDVLAANQLGCALYADLFDTPAQPANLARFVFLDHRSQTLYRDWEHIADAAAGSLRTQAGRNPSDEALSALVHELSAGSEPFRTRWAAHDVGYYRTGVQHFHHQVAGDLDLDYDALEIPADPGLTIVAYTAAAGSPAHQALDRLGNWTGAPTPRAIAAGYGTGRSVGPANETA